MVEAELWQLLEKVKDPEIPVISIVEMGIVREVAVNDEGVTVTITPTFSGCPALEVMRRDVLACLQGAGFEQARVAVTLFPPWSSDWISDSGRDKLKAFGLAPPPKQAGNLVLTFFDPVACPYCDSPNTTLQNSFGSTLCRAIYTCNNCRQPFEQFKPL